MPLYEIVLRYPDRDEVRITDRVLALGDTLEVAGRGWVVVSERKPADVRATASLVCEPDRGPLTQSCASREAEA